jgi:hypothetical protein
VVGRGIFCSINTWDRQTWASRYFVETVLNTINATYRWLGKAAAL